MNSELSSKMQSAKKIITEWLDIDHALSSEDVCFGYLDIWISETMQVSRPAYFVFAENSILVDFPFCKVDEVDDPVGELGAWGLGRVHSAFTYHNVFAYGPLLADPNGTLHLLRMIGSMAAEREFEILGERKFVKDKSEPRPTPESDENSEVNGTLGVKADRAQGLDWQTLNQEQADCLSGFINELQALVDLFGISSDAVDKNTAREMSLHQPGLVWSVFQDWSTGRCADNEGSLYYRAGFWLTPGFEEGSDDYFIGSRPFGPKDAELPLSYTEVRFACFQCEGGALAPGNCDNCQGQEELVFDLSWNGGIVQAR